ncbi:hypothetical protein [Metabacillus bambusae]|uniref:Sporulation histidine kinase inhibitor Sda n=1 Tax=Metabacillus bambusae TaxID=2795218 RepID=A0ABS3N9Q5_9BACI|nr:hypothetical protein [Metabacillus bambusae]MBO1515032.1 hypothetical protein [Metabacillus bambusae]
MLDSIEFFLFTREINRLVDDLSRCNDQSIKDQIRKEIYFLNSILEQQTV